MKLFRHLFGIIVAILAALSPANAQQKRIYIANDDHTDYYWAKDGTDYDAIFSSMLDYYLNLSDTTDGNASAYQSQFNCDGNFWLWTYERNRNATQFQRLMNCVKSGHFSAPLTTLVFCYGGQPAEAVLRGMYYPGRLERRFDYRFNLAVSMENQSLPLGLASLWAGAGATYSWRGVCGCVSQLPSPLNQRPREIYWWQGESNQRVTANALRGRLLKQSLDWTGGRGNGGRVAPVPARGMRMRGEDGSKTPAAIKGPGGRSGRIWRDGAEISGLI